MFAVRMREGFAEAFQRKNGISRDGDVFSSTDQGVTWTSIASNMPYGLLESITTNTIGHIFVGHQNGIYRTTNVGESWTNVHPGVSLPTLGTDNQGKVYAGSGSSIYSSTNNGGNWSFTSLPGVTNIADFAFDGNDVYVAAGNFEGTIGQGVYRSTNRGATFGPMNNGLTELNVTSVDVHTDPSSQCRIIVGTKGSGTFKWNGSQWLPDGLPSRPLRRIRTTNVRIASDGSKVYSQNLNCTWSTIADVQTFFAPVTDIREALSNSTGASQDISLLVATNGRGIFRGTNIVTSIPEQNVAPEGFHLDQNFPNPFNPSTKIRFQIPSTNHATIAVYDILGRHLATLVDDVLQPGTHEVTWNAVGYSSGVYVYRLSAGSYQRVRKLMLIQ